MSLKIWFCFLSMTYITVQVHDRVVCIPQCLILVHSLKDALAPCWYRFSLYFLEQDVTYRLERSVSIIFIYIYICFYYLFGKLFKILAVILLQFFIGNFVIIQYFCIYKETLYCKVVFNGRHLLYGEYLWNPHTICETNVWVKTFQKTRVEKELQHTK